MPLLLICDLTTETVEKEIIGFQYYGRGLAAKLLKYYTPADCNRLSPDNALVIAPGLFTGAPVPCATRAVVAARGDAERGIAVTSITGDLPQKLGSQNVAALLIKGKAGQKNTVLVLDGDRLSFYHLPELSSLTSSGRIDLLRSRFGSRAAVLGIGPAGDLSLPLSNLFTTYPEGTPRFTCPRSSFGDVPASKNLTAIVVRSDRVFAAPCADREALLKAGKKLSALIIADPVCGAALPVLGPGALFYLLEDGNSLSTPPANKQRTDRKIRADGQGITSTGGRKNVVCAPMCVIGCLNRHNTLNNRVLTAPEDTEVEAAVRRHFSTLFNEEEISQVTAVLASRGRELGLNTTEFVSTAALFLRQTGSPAAKEHLIALLEEIENKTVTGRLLGGGTAAVASLYRDDPDASRYETRPASDSVAQHALRLDNFYGEMTALSEPEKLYRQIFLLENLGICIFSAFAIVNNREALDLIADIFRAKTGVKMTGARLLREAGDCLRAEEELSREGLLAGSKKHIPEFVKFLYSYFSG